MGSVVVLRWLLVGFLLMSLTVCSVAKSVRTSDESAVDEREDRRGASLQDLVAMLKANIRLLQAEYDKSLKDSKRSCNGFPCMYTHLGSKAGKASKYKSLIKIIHSCVHDPNCSPGKRRRRSVRHSRHNIVSSKPSVRS